MASTESAFQSCAGRESTTLPTLARQNKACTGIHWKRYCTQKETCMPSASKVEIFNIDADCRGTISARFPRYSACGTDVSATSQFRVEIPRSFLKICVSTFAPPLPPRKAFHFRVLRDSEMRLIHAKSARVQVWLIVSIIIRNLAVIDYR